MWSPADMGVSFGVLLPAPRQTALPVAVILWIAACLVVFLAFAPWAARADDTAVLDPEAASVDLVPAASLRPDPAPADAWRDLPQSGWAPLPDGGALGLLDGPTWVRIPVHAPVPLRRHLQINELGLGTATLVHLGPDGSELARWSLRADEPLAERPIPHRTPVFPLELPRGPSTLLLRLTSEEAVQARIRLVTPERFQTETTRVSLVWAAYFGLIGGLAVYNFFLWLTLRDRAYLLYVVMMVLTHGLMQLHVGGLSFELLPTWPKDALVHAGRATTGLGALAAAAFAWEFLRVARFAPWTRWLYLPFAILAGVALFDGVLPAGLGWGASMVLLLLAPLVLVGSAVESWARGHTQARWFLLAWTVLAASALWTLARGLGFLPLIGFQGVEFLSGSAVEACLLSIALADRIRILQHDKRQAVRDVEASRREALEARLSVERQKGAFLSTMSHELRTPLHQVLGLADLLHDSEQDPQRRKDLALLKQCGGDLGRLIEDMLLYTELQGGTESTISRTCSLPDLLARCSADHRARAHAAGLRWSASHSGPTEVFADARLLGRVLDHLVDNAIKYTEHGFVDVQISASLPPEKDAAGELLIAVTDSGPGIPEARLDEVFALFRQGDDGLTRRTGGIGLGLTMCRAIAETLGGSLEVTDLDGAGTRVVLTTPVWTGPGRGTEPL